MKFGFLDFKVEGNKIFLVGQGDCTMKPHGFIGVQINGEMKPTHLGAKTVYSSEDWGMEYVSHEMKGDTLTVVQKTGNVQVATVFEKYADGNVLRIHTEVTNITEREIVLEEVSAFLLNGIFGKTVEEAKNISLTHFIQSHHRECQARELTFFEGGLHKSSASSTQRRISFTNIGSQSTKEALPQVIIADKDGNVLMFQIESNHSWYYEISDFRGDYYLGLGSANLHYCNWAKKLGAGETYKTVNVALAMGGSVNAVVEDMTKYRRAISPCHATDKSLPVIFNEYMYLSWNAPSEEKSKKIVPIAAAAGAEYYVIDCGWHDECNSSEAYFYCGAWKESNVRYPSGVKAITEYINSYGMKAGLWIEPEVVGVRCREMIDYYGDECFLRRFGKKIAVGSRYLLDYRHPKVRAYMTETIRRMVEDYGAEYIKFDYNQDIGVGTDVDALTLGEGLESAADAYLSWVDEITARFPKVIFENCASGGARLDYQSMSKFSMASTSDCVDYLCYPYIAGNVLSSILPEQSGVWSYPAGGVNSPSEITDERVVINMVNTLLGRMHLASDLSILSEKQYALVQEGIACYKALTPAKKRSLPFFPLGFAKFGDEKVASGLMDGNDLYLAVWNLSENPQTSIPLGKEIQSAEIMYPKSSTAEVKWIGDKLDIAFDIAPNALFLKLKIK